MAEWVIERLRKTHDRSAFSCGQTPLDTFLHNLVGQYEKRHLGQTFVATEAGRAQVAGYYTLSASSFDGACLPSAARSKLPRHPVPTILLGRLAVDQAYQGRRLGETLLFHALRSALDLSQRLGVHAVEVWAIDEPASDFYRRYGFIALSDDPLHSYLPMKTINAILGA